MRLGLGFACLALLAACSDARLEQARTDLGCGPIDGLKQLSQSKPAFIIVGEFIETAEAPAAFAELACNLAASGEPLFVGVSEYLGGATDAETKMRARLDALKTRGALISIAVIDDGSRENDTRARTRSEKKWAGAITSQVKASGASRALILVAHTDARNASWPRGERFAGYDPMPMHLDGVVLSLEIGSTPATGLKAPTIRFYPGKTNGFSGQVALASLTRPDIEINAASVDVIRRGTPLHERISPTEHYAVLRSTLSREEKIGRIAAVLEAEYEASAREQAERNARTREQIADPFLREIVAPETVLEPGSAASRNAFARARAARLVDAYSVRQNLPTRQVEVLVPEFDIGDEPLNTPPPATDLPEFGIEETP